MVFDRNRNFSQFRNCVSRLRENVPKIVNSSVGIDKWDLSYYIFVHRKFLLGLQYSLYREDAKKVIFKLTVHQGL